MQWYLSAIFNMFNYYQLNGLLSSISKEEAEAFKSSMQSVSEWMKASQKEDLPLGAAFILLKTFEERLKHAVEHHEILNAIELLSSFIACHIIAWKAHDDAIIYTKDFFYANNGGYVKLYLPHQYGLPKLAVKKTVQLEIDLLFMIEFRVNPTPQETVRQVKKYCRDAGYIYLNEMFLSLKGNDVKEYAIIWLEEGNERQPTPVINCNESSFGEISPHPHWHVDFIIKQLSGVRLRRDDTYEDINRDLLQVKMLDLRDRLSRLLNSPEPTSSRLFIAYCAKTFLDKSKATNINITSGRFIDFFIGCYVFLFSKFKDKNDFIEEPTIASFMNLMPEEMCGQQLKYENFAKMIAYFKTYNPEIENIFSNDALSNFIIELSEADFKKLCITEMKANDRIDAYLLKLMLMRLKALGSLSETLTLISLTRTATQLGQFKDVIKKRDFEHFNNTASNPAKLYPTETAWTIIEKAFNATRLSLIENPPLQQERVFLF